jgi:hypothetical protein
MAEPYRLHRITVGDIVDAKLKAALGSLTLAISVLAASAQGTISNPTYTPAYLNGSCQVPHNDSPVSGHGSVTYDLLTYRPLSNTVVTCSVHFPLPFSPVAAGIHGPANPGQTAPLLFDLGEPRTVTNIITFISWPPVSNPPTFTNISVGFSNRFSVAPHQMNDFKAGGWYINVSSTNFPEGELRGQLTDAPVLSRPVITGTNGFAFDVTGASTRDYTVYVSTNLPEWFILTNLRSTNNLFQIIDHQVRDPAHRFYRVKLN